MIEYRTKCPALIHEYRAYNIFYRTMSDVRRLFRSWICSNSLNLRSEIWRRSLNENIDREWVHNVSVIFLDSESSYFNGSCYRWAASKKVKREVTAQKYDSKLFLKSLCSVCSNYIILTIIFAGKKELFS